MSKETVAASSEAAPRQNLFFIEYLRFIAAIAVVAIHVLGPYREQVVFMDLSQWLAPVGVNALSRWAVPVFIMISGALLLSDARPFDCSRYLQRRVAKVVLPFLIWSLIYAWFGGWTEWTWSWAATKEIIELSPNHPTWYHLWFFYDFIPLYFVIPFLALTIKGVDQQRLLLLLSAFALLSVMHWLKVETALRQNIILYSGYLIAGWYLFTHDQGPYLKLWRNTLIAMLALNIIGSVVVIEQIGEYSSMFMGYKSLNTALIAASLFVLAKYHADSLQQKWRKYVSLVSKYSLGIYLIHPALLIPVRYAEFGVYQWFGTPWLAIPVLTVVALLLALALSWLLAKSRLTNWMVP